MTTQEAAGSSVQEKGATQARWLRVKIVDNTAEGRPAFNVKMPVAVVRFGMKMAQAFSPEMKAANVDWGRVNAMIDDGQLGKIVDVEDEAAHQTIEVWVE